MSARAATVFEPMPDRPRFQAPERGASAPAWRGAAACLLVTVVALVTALIATNAAGVPLRDPSHVTEGRLTKALLLVAVLIAVDCVIRGRERWPAARLAMTGGVVLAFYATYFAYRNLKSIVPLLRDELFDRRLGDIDRSVFGGRDPAQVLHDLLGTGISAEFLSVIYGLFFVFVPVSVALALVVPRDPRPGLFFVTALSLNWVLAAGSYFLLPSLGPVYAQPENFADLPSTGRQPPADGAAQPAHSTSCTTRRPPARRRASARSRRCTSRSSSPPRSRRSCSAPRGACPRWSGRCWR